MKVIGVGFGKTGTTTLAVCMRAYGFKHQTYDKRATGMYQREAMTELMAWMERYESFDDFPWCLLYRQADQLFPGSKFILTRRTTPAVWLRSLSKHIARRGPWSDPALRQHLYGNPNPQDHPEQSIKIYQQHLEAVRSYFAGREKDFLEVCWEEGDDWVKLSEFLNRPQPQRPFPHANQSPRPRSRLRAALETVWPPGNRT